MNPKRIDTPNLIFTDLFRDLEALFSGFRPKKGEEAHREREREREERERERKREKGEEEEEKRERLRTDKWSSKCGGMVENRCRTML